MLKAYKYRVYPNRTQQQTLAQMFGCSRYIYNWGLETKTKAYTTNKETLSSFDLANQLPKLKEEKEWLKIPPSQTLQMALRNLDNAFQSFFRQKTEYPKFKSKKTHYHTLQFPQGVKIDKDNNIIKLPKIGIIRCKFHRNFLGIVKTVTLSQVPSGKYFISILIDDQVEEPQLEVIDPKRTVGVDLGLHTFAAISNGTKIPSQVISDTLKTKLKKLQRQHAKAQKGSKNKEKLRIKVARTYEKITNIKNDILHKVSKQLIDDNQVNTIALETLNIKGMLKNKKLSSQIHDASWYKFVSYLEYKARWAGKNILRIGQFEPSSKLCSSCGYKKDNLKLSDREWQCPECGSQHDRDINAAINIRDLALHSQNLVGLGQSKPKACGSCSDGAAKVVASHHGMKQEASSKPKV